MTSVAVEQFTDPYSPWCWAAQPALRRLRYEFDDVRWTPRMTLLLPGPAAGTDPEGDGTGDDDGPIDDHGPTDDDMRRTRWAALVASAGMPVAEDPWAEGLESSRPTCAAVAFVRETAPERALPVLRRLRVAAFAEGRSLGEPAEVADVVGEVEGVEAEAVRRGLEDGRAADALESDLERAVEAADELDSVEVRGDVRLLDAAERLGSMGSGVPGGDAADSDEDDSNEPKLLGPPALRVERESVVVADPRLPYGRLASAFGRSVPKTGIEIDDKFATSRMAMHVPREVAESLSSEDFGDTVRPYLARFGRAYLPEVVAGTGVSRDTCLAALDSLVERGEAERVGPEEWRIVDEPGGPGSDT